MDTYKLKWKMKFRIKQFKGRFKLIECKFRKKHNLMGDDDLYYHLQLQYLPELISADPEYEYLAEHGLLPEEEEPEVEVEPEKVQEPGLLREFSFLELIRSGTHYEGKTYIANALKEYEDRIWILVAMVEDCEPRDYEFTFPTMPQERYLNFAIEGQELRFDRQNLRIEVYEPF